MKGPISARTEYAHVRMALNHPIDEVWAIAGRFGGLEAWADGVSACTVEGAGVGAVRSVTRGGVVREQLETLDPHRHQMSYRILAPHTLPAEDVRSWITLRALGPRETEIVWRSEARRFHVPPGPLSTRIEAFYRASIQGLDQRLRAAGSGEPETRAGDEGDPTHHERGVKRTLSSR